MSPAERAIFIAREKYMRALREHLREIKHVCAECTFEVAIVGGRGKPEEEFLRCKHGRILGVRHETWG